MISAIDNAIFVPLWPLGIVFPIIATIFLFYKRKSLIFYVPIISTVIWAIPRIFFLRSILFATNPDEQNAQYPLDIPLESLIITGTIGLTLVVLTLSALTTWVTHKVLKKSMR